MVNSSCKKLSWIELIYSVNARFVKFLKKENVDLIPESCKDYLEKGSKNDTIYRTRDSEAVSKLQFLFNHTQDLYHVVMNCGQNITPSKEFKLLSRFISEQTIQNKSDEFILKAGKDIPSNSLQKPTDEDATYRKNIVRMLVILLIF